MKRILLFVLPVLLVIGAFSYPGFQATTPHFYYESDSTALKPKEHYAKEAQLVTQLLEMHHFRKMKFTDSLSSVLLDEFIAALDGNRSYFLASDLEEFEVHRYKLDDYLKGGHVGIAYDIFNVFQKRFTERMEVVRKDLIHRTFDYTKEEYYDIDRSKANWANSEEELTDIWRKAIKSQALSLMLSGKSQEEITTTLNTRYERLEKAIGQYNSEDIFQLFMNTLSETYDPHTNYFSPRTSEVFQQNMSLSLEGIGARLQMENDYTKVVQVMPGGPAQKSNLIKENDRIIAVAQGEDGEMVDVIGWRLDDVVKLIKGPKGTTVRLTLLPAETGVNGPPVEIKLVREKIKIEDQEAKKQVLEVTRNGKKMKLGVITIPTFYMDFAEYQKGNPNYNSTTRDVKRLVEELKAENIDGLMIDLRENGGGSLTEAIDLTGLFIKDGPVVQVKAPNNRVEVGKDTDSSIAWDGPLTVMINRFSASASEIFAGAIQDYKRGVVIGEQSFGKGTVQSMVDLGRYIPNAGGELGQLKLTFQKFYRITGSSTQHRGVSPDITMPSAFSAEEYGESANPSALPWDQIKKADFKSYDKVNAKTLQLLTQSHDARLKNDQALKNLVEDTRELKQNLTNTRISLHEPTRRKEMEESEKRKASRTKPEATSVDAETGKPAKDKIEVKDTYLREGLFILSDLILIG
jgi:carboxyl-terminal processing protease